VDTETGHLTLSYDQLQERLSELEAVVEALRDHQVDAIVGETDVALVHLRQVEVALRESGERYRAFVANSSEGIWRYEIDPPMPLLLSEDEQFAYFYEHGYVAECNDAMAQLWGLERAADLIGLRGDAHKGFPQQAAILRHFIRSNYRVARMESEDVNAHGNRRWLSMSLMGSVKDGALTRTWGVQQDVTARRQNEEDLRTRTDELTEVLALTRDLASTVELEPLLAKILARLHGVVQYTSGYIAMIEGKDLQIIGYDGPLPRETVLRKMTGLAEHIPFRSLLDTRRASILDLPTLVGLAPAGGWSSTAADLWFPRPHRSPGFLHPSSSKTN
jgi:PAS domain-containing protein